MNYITSIVFSCTAVTKLLVTLRWKCWWLPLVSNRVFYKFSADGKKQKKLKQNTPGNSYIFFEVRLQTCAFRLVLYDLIFTFLRSKQFYLI